MLSTRCLRQDRLKYQELKLFFAGNILGTVDQPWRKGIDFQPLKWNSAHHARSSAEGRCLPRVQLKAIVTPRAGNVSSKKLAAYLVSKISAVHCFHKYHFVKCSTICKKAQLSMRNKSLLFYLFIMECVCKPFILCFSSSPALTPVNW